MKTNSYVKFANILNLLQLYLDSIDLSKVLADSAKPTLRERESTSDRQLQNINSIA